MYKLLLLVFLIGCTNPDIPPEWNMPRESSYTGDFSNFGLRGDDRIVRGLTGFFWPGSLMDADMVRLRQDAGGIAVEAFKAGNALRSEVFPLTEGMLILKRNSIMEGIYYQINTIFIRNKNGLVVDNTEEAWAPSIPPYSKVKYWVFYPLK